MFANTRAAIVGGLLATVAFAPTQAFAWGHTGHVMIGRIAVQKLPAEVPAFVRTAQATQQIGELAAEADISEGTGYPTTGTYPNLRTAFTIHDGERDAGHFVDLSDDGTMVENVAPFSPLQSSRRDFDTQLRLAGPTITTYRQYDGYLAYNLVDQFQQVRKDFALIRAFTKAIQTATTAEDRSYFQYQLQLRQTLTLRDIGYWSHFVGDTSQPMNVLIHYNGWDPNHLGYANPNGYTQAPIHSPFEGSFVKAFVNQSDVAALVPAAYADCACTIELRTINYVKASALQVGAVYAAAGTDLYTTAVPAELTQANVRLAAGATELRDLIVFAYRDSVNVTVGFPSIKVSDIENGTIVLTPTRFARD